MIGYSCSYINTLESKKGAVEKAENAFKSQLLPTLKTNIISKIMLFEKIKQLFSSFFNNAFFLLLSFSCIYFLFLDVNSLITLIVILSCIIILKVISQNRILYKWFNLNYFYPIDTFLIKNYKLLNYKS